MPNKLSQFWQELKRRKVVRVITVYAAAAFVILELLSIIIEPLRLPDWTLQFAIVFLCIGFIIAVILSWIYDVHPEGGIVKTEPAHKVKEEEKPATSSGWKIASYISFVVIVALIVLNIIPRTGNKGVIDKSIAVLPFRNDSPDESKMYFINGTMEAILDNLSKIEDLRVPGRTSVEQYRNNPKPISTVAEELDVSYILEGSGHKDGNNVRLVVQLLDGKMDRHLWSKTYDSDIEEIFSMQSEIAQLVAAEIEAIITPEEIQRIEKVPTTNLIAYDLYLKAKDQHALYREQGENIDALIRAISYYQLVLEYDSTFARAYTGLALAYRDKHYDETYFKDNFLDSTLALANISLSFDNRLEEAYRVRALYYRDYGRYDEAIDEYTLGLKYNPNSWQAYTGLAGTYWQNGNQVKYVESSIKAIQLNRGKKLPNLLRTLGSGFIILRMDDLGEQYYKQAFDIDHDITSYNNRLVTLEFSNFDHGKIYFEERIEEDLGQLRIDSTLNLGYRLGYAYSVLGLDDSAYIYFKKYADNLKETDYSGLSILHRLGYGFWKAGHKEEAKIFFDKHLFQCTESIKRNRPYANRMGAIYDLAGYYAFFGEKEKAYEFLDQFVSEIDFFGPFWFRWILYDPMFNDIREEAKFQGIISQMELKDQKQKEQVILWLEENDML